jgi:signal transduction histidine kinase
MIVRLRRRLPRPTVRLRLTALYGGLFLLSGAGLLAVTSLFVAGVPGQLLPPGPPGYGRALAGTGSPDPMRASISAALVHDLVVRSGMALAIMAVVSVCLGWLVAGRALRPLRVITATTRQISENNLHRRLALDGPDDEIKDLADTVDGLLARLEGSFDAQRRFVANASHELRTPITLGRAMLQVALANPALTLDSLRSACEEVLDAGRHQEGLIEALLTLATSQAGLAHRDCVDLGVVAANAVHSHEADAAARGLSLEAACSSAPISGDARLVERMASNLVENALRHNVRGGRVQVTVDAKQGHARLRVTNTGPHVAADQIERLLQPFQRLDAERAGTHDGLGLGLSIVAAIVKAHGATLAIDPGLDGGLYVEVRLPTLQGRPRSAQPLEPARRPGPQPPGLTRTDS